MDSGVGLAVRNVAKRYGSVEVLADVSLGAPPGRVTALLGPNGAGKSTLFHIIMGLVSPDAGAATVDGREILPLPLHRKRDAGLGFLPQDAASFAELSVRENMRALLELLPMNRLQREERLGTLVERLGLTLVADRLYGRLSGGEQRRVEIAKALAQRPRILLLDEPFAGLDPHIVEGLANTIRGLAAEGTGVLLTDHNVHVTLSFVDYAYVLTGGRILCEGTAEEVSADPAARSLYLGAGFDSRATAARKG